MIDLIEQENILSLYWEHYKKCLTLTHTGECDDQEFIELGYRYTGNIIRSVLH